MSNSYRIRTQVGVDKRIDFKLEQDFEFLEVLSLKITQSELYDRVCSDYGVIAGRVNVNGGFGVPNAKVSVFIPLTDEDALNPIISSIYPYRNFSEVNEDGYRYNLLPYVPSYDGHVPTGTFPTRNDVLTNKTLVEVYDKYYKFSVKTNKSGDFMIFGVPVGSVKLFMDVDLSDIGEFSLSPQDMIRMGLASENQVNGLQFNSSNNLYSLPQIISLVAEVEVAPLWGDPELCQMSITRNDFDLAEAGIMIEPTAIFMGSIISTMDKYSLKRYNFQKQRCGVRLKMGELCRLTTGPGEIVAIRQTINLDSLGRPILEQYVLEDGGKVIDENGTWLIDIPMNMDYLITDEFGNQIISTDPTKGIPTTAKYRFKIKWEQPTNQNNQNQRAYFLVPNIKEYWTANADPNRHQQTGSILSIPTPVSSTGLQDLESSYAFSLDWNDYGMVSNATIAATQINEAINADDKFYKFTFNKVYTVAQLIDQYRGGILPRRINSIKNILDETCEDTNPFPVNDAQFQLDFLYLLFSLFLKIMTPILLVIMLLQHILAFLLYLLRPIIYFFAFVIGYITYGICKMLNKFRKLFGGETRDCGTKDEIKKRAEELADLYKRFTNVPLPNLTFPDCEMCNCKSSSAGYDTVDPYALQTQQYYLNTNNSSILSDWNSPDMYDRMYEFLSNFVDGWFESSSFADPTVRVMSGLPFSSDTSTNGWIHDFTMVVPGETMRYSYTTHNRDGCGRDEDRVLERKRNYLSPNLTTAERLNLFNTKAKFFNSTAFGGSPNNGGTANFGTGSLEGVNQIKVTFNSADPNNSGKYHLDNVMILSCDSGTQSDFKSGTIVYFNGTNFSSDVNALSASTDNDEGIPSITGSTIIGGSIYTGTTTTTFTTNVTWADPDNFTGVQNTNYRVSADTRSTAYHRWPADIEYYQVITAMTYSSFKLLTNNGAPLNAFNKRFIDWQMNIYKHSYPGTYNSDWVMGYKQQVYPLFRSYDLSYNELSGSYDPQVCSFYQTPLINFSQSAWARNLYDAVNPNMGASSEGTKQVIVILVRGVDPYSTRNINTYDLSKIFGYNFGSGPSVTGKFKLNIPIQPGIRNAKHDQITSNTSTSNYSNNSGIYYDTFNYLPGSDFTGFTTNLHTYYSALDSTTRDWASQPYNITGKQSGNDYSSIAGAGDLRVKGAPPSRINTGSGIVTFPTSRNQNTPYNMMTTDFTYQLVVGILEKTFSCGNPAHAFEQDGVWSPVDNFNSNNPRGYYRNESIEGGSLITLELGQPNNSTNNSTRLGYICRNCFCNTNEYYQPLVYQTTNPESYYWSPSYPKTLSLSFATSPVSKRKIVMRSDRLPTSTNEVVNGFNSYQLHQNPNFAIYTADDDGTITAAPNVSFGPVSSGPIDTVSGNVSPDFVNVIDSLNECGKMLPLKCYYNDNTAPFFGVNANNSIDLRWDGTCTTLTAANITRPIFDVGVGCYLFVTRPILSIKVDILMLLEWKSRLDLTFGACRNVFGHMFTNNWINGVLYAYSFKNDIFFTKPFDPNGGNQPFANYCYDTIYFSQTTNTFYYRSAPFLGTNSTFVGINNTLPNSPGNRENINNPTTITDLGPRSSYLTYLSNTNQFNGYNMSNLTPSTFNDTSDILNVYILSRLANAGFWDSLFGARGAGILGLFSRVKRSGFSSNPKQKNMVDGDFAQLISINSELGVRGFDGDNYGIENPAYVQIGTDSTETVVGIFFDSDQQPRDFITPKREIFNELTVSPYLNSFDSLPVNDQVVPFYGWEIKLSSSPVIFGSQQNDWNTGTIKSLNYQRQDRLDLFQTEKNLSTYFNYMNNNSPTTPSLYNRGYIYNIKTPGTSTQFEQNPFLAGINGDQSNDLALGVGYFQVGAPFHFYFGIRKGATAYDRFRIKWIEGEKV